MITLKLRLARNGRYRGYEVFGHADSEVKSGEYDLVCAAVSGMTLTCALGLQDILHLDGRYDSLNGFMNVDLMDQMTDQSDLLIKTMFHGLETIREKYPGTLRLIEIKG